MVQQLLHLFRKSIDAKCSHVRNLILISLLITEREISGGLGGGRKREVYKSLLCSEFSTDVPPSHCALTEFPPSKPLCHPHAQ